MLSPTKLFIAAMALASFGVAAPEPEHLNNLEARACPGGSYNNCIGQTNSQCQGQPPAGLSQCISIWQGVCQRNC
ncbi:hypothetical protein BHE90_014914 [Fusarium euwallaceae]|uniref:Uncharacterized protein n=5 Tax=Fusarium solani species complex TaxID=232080 RepID=A0A3M2S8Z7_9HYPO|nr:hypothetical protein CDV36_006264 [Fusarium kuroshium]RSL70077.1 hypothetical protein CEP51_012258 [Fusarium floridanum]RSM09063.1 hypothetical protein CDV31_007830 [Fusarium ambrosium]RSM11720.1 hypothetical protein CEP52_002825 [Fusarium oligoseptatum]RTE70690.1 hypothetical protein BHE90_014914 [Fusarium euwallaceae]